MTMTRPADETLADTPRAYPLLTDEAHAFARYLVGQDAPADMLERYSAASASLIPEAPTSSEQAMLTFCLRHRWTLPAIDAAAGPLRPDCLLRKKIYLMAAVLEAAPDFASDFLPREAPLWMLAAELAASILSSGLKVAFGLALLPLAERSAV
jgi:hypothetical protein